MKVFSDFIDFIIKNWKTFFGPVLSAFVVVLGWFILPRLNNRFNNQKSIVIEGSTILNVNNWSGLPQQLLSEEQYFSNLIFNKLTVNNKRSQSQAVTAVELRDINLAEEKFSDIQFDGGFYYESQNFLLLTYNNGNGDGVVPDGTLRFIAYQDGLQNGNIIEKHKISSIALASGEVRSLFVKSLDDISKSFITDIKLTHLTVEFLFNIPGKKTPSLVLIFDRLNGKFQNGQFGGSASSPEDVSVIKITGNREKELVSCSQSLSSGINEIKFLVWVPKSCTLNYRVVLHVGKKQFEDKNQYHLKVRVPIYKQESGHFYGIFYFLLQKNCFNVTKKLAYKIDDIRFLDSSLIYDKYYIAKEFYNVDFGKID